MPLQLPRQSRRTIRAVASCLFIALFGVTVLAAPNRKTDVVHFDNGDRLTGEIKLLQRGILSLSTAAMKTVEIRWTDVYFLQSDKQIQVEMISGERVTGYLEGGANDESIAVRTANGSRTLSFEDVVRMAPLRTDEPIWSRIDGSVSAGYSYAQSTDIAQLTVASNASLREEKYIVNARLSSLITRQKAADQKNRSILAGSYQRLRPERWFWSGFASAEQNDELGLDLRVLAGASFGRYIVQSPYHELTVQTGLALSRELTLVQGQDAAEQDRNTVVEGLLGAEYSIFRLNIPKTELTSSLTYFRGFETNRNRSNIDIRLRQELIADLFWDISLYQTYDSQPPEGSSSADVGVVTSVGISF